MIGRYLARFGVAALLLGIMTQAQAQSTGAPSVMGYLSSSNHSCGQTTCFVQYGATIPTGGGGTNDVNIKQVNGITVLTGAGATGTGSQRTTVAQDTTTIAGSAPGTAGSASANVVTVQGIANGTVVPTSPAQSGANVAVTPTIQNAAYVSGNCMGGFQTVAMGTGASVLNAITLSSKGGLATAKQIYLFSANPSGSTCTDKSTFTIASADISKVMQTISITPVAPTGTTITFAIASNLGLGIPSGGTFYLAIVETASETPASTSDLAVLASGF